MSDRSASRLSSPAGIAGLLAVLLLSVCIIAAVYPEFLFGAAKRGNVFGPARVLMTIATAQADFRSNDRDRNGQQEYWRSDLAGLYFARPPGQEMIRLIEFSVALADADPKTPLPEPAAPRAGYWYRSLGFRDEKTPDTKRFAACAYPASLSSGRVTFIISDAGTVYLKRFQDRVVLPDSFPDDPLKEGWMKAEW